MADPFEVGVRRRAVGDHYDDWIDEQTQGTQLAEQIASPLDSDGTRKIHSRLMGWLFHERAKQADNRLQMAMDADFYDGEQWDSDDADALRERRQIPLVFNEVAPMVDWLIGTERRTRIDWKVLPRAEDDVETADAKTKVLKFISDTNRVPFARSRAFADAAKAGLGWVDDGARDDPTEDVLYSKYEDWRNVLHDSSSYELDLSDARYVFRWRWVDADIAELMFKNRKAQIRRAVVEAGSMSEADLQSEWYLGEPVAQSGHLYSSGAGVSGDSSRRRIKLIECQFRMPATSKIIADGPMKGAYFNPEDQALAQYIAANPASIIDKLAMRVHFAVFTETDMLALGPSTYRHNRFTLTPIWCYRRGKDRLPYGAIRRVRDIQQDLNKRASKALFMLSTNQVIADEGAVENVEIARQEIDMPDGWVTKKQGKELRIQRDTDAATGQIQMMSLDAQTIQRVSGVNNENLGRQTNAVSGEAIKARQLQGSVGTTEPFDNLRYAVQVQGEKQLSLTEQFYSEEKVIRLTGASGKIDWMRINQPEMQPDGSVRYINDITASQSDFVVSEADYAGTMRQVMFDGITAMAQRLPPEIALRLFIIAMDFADLPNHDEISDSIRQAIGERDPNKQMTPEEAQQAEQQMQAQAEALQMQREQAALALAEQRAKVEKLNAEAQEIMARAQSQGSGGMPPEYEEALRQVQEQAAQRLEAMAEQLRKVQGEAANKTMAINRDADVKMEIARVDAASRERVAEIQAKATTQMDALMRRLDEVAETVRAAVKTDDDGAGK
ncbi:MAG: hypothetical protein RJA63_2295 [Pseudomonadota bacterium]|jgi:hypothetical protein